MKTIRYLLSAVLLMVAFSCQQEPVLNENENANLQADTSGFQLSSHAATLEGAMQVNSFAVAKVARYNPTFRTVLENHLNLSNDNIVKLDEFLSDIQLTSSGYQDYYMAIWKIYTDPDPDVPATSPPPPPPPPGGPGGPDNNVDGPDALISYLRNVHCIEMYFPVGLDFSEEPYEITSTAHHLNSNKNKYGYVRYFDLTQVGPRTWRYANYVDFIDQNYVNNNANIIVTRPYRDLSGDNDICDYDEYSGIDFTDFLDQ